MEKVAATTGGYVGECQPKPAAGPAMGMAIGPSMGSGDIASTKLTHLLPHALDKLIAAIAIGKLLRGKEENFAGTRESDRKSERRVDIQTACNQRSAYRQEYLHDIYQYG